jgi:rSAM/selenodomain-associated transferase 1
MTTTAALVVLAKSPVPGRVKTRLCPPLDPEEAADVAAAALADTLDVVAASRCARRILVLDGQIGPWLPPGFSVIPQSDGDLATRLAGAFAAVAGPAVLVGMDTPQLTTELLDRAVSDLERPGTDAVLGPACDGGYWAIGLCRPERRAFDDVPMSVEQTATRQIDQLRALGLRVSLLPWLRDVDRYEDAVLVARAAPATRFAARMRSRERVAARV